MVRLRAQGPGTLPCSGCVCRADRTAPSPHASLCTPASVAGWSDLGVGGGPPVTLLVALLCRSVGHAWPVHRAEGRRGVGSGCAEPRRATYADSFGSRLLRNGRRPESTEAGPKQLRTTQRWRLENMGPAPDARAPVRPSLSLLPTPTQGTRWAHLGFLAPPPRCSGRPSPLEDRVSPPAAHSACP